MFFRRKKANVKRNTMGERMDRLDAEGNLPFGWVVYNRDVADKIDAEVKCFTDAIDDSTCINDKRNALRSFVQYLADGQMHYNNMGICVGKYFSEHIIDSTWAKGYIEQLSHIEQNYDLLLKEEQERLQKKEEMEKLSCEILDRLKGCDGMLQADFIKTFDASIKSDVSFLLNSLDRQGKVERIKAGRTYILHLK